MSIRLRRLAADYEIIRYEFAGHNYIDIKVLEGDPPERYLVTYKNIKGLKLDKELSRPVETYDHRLEIYLHKEYPREKPLLTMKSEIFHPNFGSSVCIADDWTASARLADIIFQIGEMIQYQNYNTKSPMNAIAARWAMENQSYLPIDNINLYQADPDIVLELSKNSNEDCLDIELR